MISQNMQVIDMPGERRGRVAAHTCPIRNRAKNEGHRIDDSDRHSRPHDVHVLCDQIDARQPEMSLEFLELALRVIAQLRILITQPVGEAALHAHGWVDRHLRPAAFVVGPPKFGWRPTHAELGERLEISALP